MASRAVGAQHELEKEVDLLLGPDALECGCGSLDGALHAPDCLFLVLPTVDGFAPAAEALARPAQGEEAPKRQRLTMKRRLEGLREEAAALTLTLQAEASRASAARLESNSQRLARVQAAAMWKRVAERQLRLRARAERENAQLRRLVRSQSRHLAGVSVLLQQRPHQQEVDAVVKNLGGVPRAVALADNCSDVILELTSRLHREYAHLSRLWSDAGVDGLAVPTRKCLTPSHSVRANTRISYVDRVAVPFDAELVERATWAFLQDPRLWRPFAGDPTRAVLHCDDTVRTVFSGEAGFSGYATSFTHASVSRKFVESDRTVFMSSAFIKPRVRVDDSLSSVRFFLLSARVIKRGASLSTGECSTVIDSLRRSCAFDADGMDDCRRKLEPYVGIGLATMDATMTHELQAIEDLTLQLQRSSLR